MSYGRGRYNRSPACIYVGNLPEDIEEREIEDIFHKFGRIKDIDIKRGRNTSGTAFCFIDFENVRDAEDAIERRQNYQFHRHRLRVEFTGERKPRRKDGSGGPPTRTDHRLIVTNLPQGCSWQLLKDHMRTAGNVGYANIEMKKGIVEFLRYEDMNRALRKLDNTELRSNEYSSIIKVRRDKSPHRRSESYHRKDRRSRSISSSRSRRRNRSRSPSTHSSSSRHSVQSKRSKSSVHSRHGSHYSEPTKEEEKSQHNNNTDKSPHQEEEAS